MVKKNNKVEMEDNEGDDENLDELDLDIPGIVSSNPPRPMSNPLGPRPGTKPDSLENALLALNKRFGEGSLMKLGDASKMKVEAIPTGVITVDAALGVGGVPRGRMIEIFGPESGGKTTLTLHIAAEAQKLGGTVAFIDVEHALDPSYAAALGVDISNLIINQPNSGEEALEIVEALVRSGAVQLIIVDSVAALVPKKELEGEMGDSVMGAQARLMSQACRKLTSAMGQNNCTVIFINQIREKIGVMFGNPETTTGGRALRFFASVRMEVRKSETLKDKGGQETGNKVKVKVVKNKVSPPFRTGEGEIWFGEGFRRESSILDLAVEKDLIKRAGAWYSYEGEKVGQGRDNAIAHLMENQNLTNSLEDILRKDLFGE